MIKEMQVRGVFAENSYFYIDPLSRAGFLIDPGAQAGLLFEAVQRNGWHIENLLLTHGDFHHMGAAEVMREKLVAPIYIHPSDADHMTAPRLNLSAASGQTLVVPNYENLHDGEVIQLKENNSFRLKVIHTPGHTPGSVTFYCEAENAAFVGDTLYEHGPGITDFPGGNRRELEVSIVNKILRLPPDTLLLSGHSSPITVADESRLLFGN